VLENGSREEDVLVELARLGLEPACELVPMREALLLDQDLRRYPVRSEAPFAYLVRRGEGEGTLDYWLRSEAENVGVRLEEGSAGDGWQPDVVATGPARADGVAREMVFRTSAADVAAVLFDPGLTPTGYSYLFVRDGWGTLGAAMVRGVGRLRRAAAKAFAILRRELEVEVEEEVGEQVLFMNFGIPRHLSSRDAWYVGEAAGVQDFLFGLGNRLALRSAALVAAAVSGEEWDEPEFVRSIARPMETSVLGRAAFELAGPAATTAACRWLSGGDFRSRLVALQRPTGPRSLLARFVMALWRDRGGCDHLPVARWCRRRER